MTLEQLVRANKISDQLKNLSDGAYRIIERIDADDISLDNCPLFSGTSSLTYDTGLNTSELRKEMIEAMRVVVNKYLIERRKELEAL